MRKVALMTARQLKASHIEVWQHLFSSGLSISTSKAAGALNGDRINATLYLTLSQVSSDSVESEMSQSERDRLHYHLAYTEGCYGGHHHTLQATRLWSDLSSIESVVKVTSLWLKTLETQVYWKCYIRSQRFHTPWLICLAVTPKFIITIIIIRNMEIDWKIGMTVLYGWLFQGCHKLVKMGAEGVMQAMLLSFGAWKFSNQHLEFNTEPRDLHRDYHYRRINYGNGTHVNVTISVLEDNKAALYLALDRSDKDYYACDGGCLDAPVQLGPERTQFPVKLTDPPTAVLYITSDKQHMEDLKHTIHVKEVAEGTPFNYSLKDPKECPLPFYSGFHSVSQQMTILKCWSAILIPIWCDIWLHFLLHFSERLFNVSPKKKPISTTFELKNSGTWQRNKYSKWKWICVVLWKRNVSINMREMFLKGLPRIQLSNDPFICYCRGFQPNGEKGSTTEAVVIYLEWWKHSSMHRTHVI